MEVAVGFEDDEGLDDPALSVLLDGLADVFCKDQVLSPGPTKLHLGRFVRARVAGGDDRASALEGGKNLLRNVIAAIKTKEFKY